MELLLLFAFLATLLMLLNHYLKGLDESKKGLATLFASIDAQLQMGRTLILKETEIFKRYAQDENEIIEKVIKLIQNASAAKSIDKKIGANEVLNNAIISFHARTDRYPGLTSDPEYMQLQDALSKVDQALMGPRRLFNIKVKEFNEMLEKFPRNIMAVMGGLKKQQYFEPDELPAEPVRIINYSRKGVPAPLRVFEDGTEST